MSNSLIKIFLTVWLRSLLCLLSVWLSTFGLPSPDQGLIDIFLGCDSHWRTTCMLPSLDSEPHLNSRHHLLTIRYETALSSKVSMNLSWAHMFFLHIFNNSSLFCTLHFRTDDSPSRLLVYFFINMKTKSCYLPVFIYTWAETPYC